MNCYNSKHGNKYLVGIELIIYSQSEMFQSYASLLIKHLISVSQCENNNQSSEPYKK